MFNFFWKLLLRFLPSTFFGEQSWILYFSHQLENLHHSWIYLTIDPKAPPDHRRSIFPLLLRVLLTGSAVEYIHSKNCLHLVVAHKPVDQKQALSNLIFKHSSPNFSYYSLLFKNALKLDRTVIPDYPVLHYHFPKVAQWLRGRRRASNISTTGHQHAETRKPTWRSFQSNWRHDWHEFNTETYKSNMSKQIFVVEWSFQD